MLEIIEKNIGYSFVNSQLLELAFVHKSYSNKLNNERLEFLGDTILNSIISQYLFLKYPEASEGHLSRIRSMLVQSQSLADKAKSIKLNKAVKLSKGTANLKEDNKQSIYEGCFESLIGAVFLDGGLDQATIVAINLFSKELDEISLENSFKDPKTQLQEVFQSRGMSPPTYSHFENNSGFECSLTFQEKCYSSLSKSKQGAELKVAEKVLKDIGHTHD